LITKPTLHSGMGVLTAGADAGATSSYLPDALSAALRSERYLNPKPITLNPKPKTFTPETGNPKP